MWSNIPYSSSRYIIILHCITNNSTRTDEKVLLICEIKKISEILYCFHADYAAI